MRRDFIFEGFLEGGSGEGRERELEREEFRDWVAGMDAVEIVRLADRWRV